MSTPAISIRAPWWWFILHGGKDIENRDWPTRYRGPVFIHASTWFRPNEIKIDFDYAREIAEGAGVNIPGPVTLRNLKDAGGYLVGTADVIDCVDQSDSPWFFGSYGFVLANARPLDTPIPCKGALGFFRPDVDVTTIGSRG